MTDHIRETADEVTDPLIGTQEETDSPYEALHVPPSEVVLEHPALGRPTHARWLAAMLGVFLGSLGMHRFYLGFRSVGLFQLSLTLAIISSAILGGILGGEPRGWSIGLVVIGVLMLPVLWGFAEGCCIGFHVLNRDADGHPLA